MSWDSSPISKAKQTIHKVIELSEKMHRHKAENTAVFLIVAHEKLTFWRSVVLTGQQQYHISVLIILTLMDWLIVTQYSVYVFSN